MTPSLAEIKAAAEEALSHTWAGGEIPVGPSISGAYQDAVRAEKALAAHCLWLLERVEELAEALNNEELKSAALRMAIDDGDDYGEHVGLQKYRCALLTGREEVLEPFRAALARLEGE